ncbi:MAG: hypothetical protein KGL39_46905 [Patescibacteria group bacterium]|nr:hypothetical protein [Patescibacteria group bacterium]
MSLLTESALNGLPISLYAGVEQISEGQTLTFNRYTKATISQDGYVFWVAGGKTLSATGSLHYATSQEQSEDQTIGINAVLFTSEQQVTEFNAISDTTLWVADWQTPGGNTIQIAFSRQGPYFPQSQLWHYSGFAVYPALASQLVQSASDLPLGPIVSDSLPIWLALPTSLPTVAGFQAPTIPVYPSFLVPSNITPPYIVAHVEATQALGSFPILTWPGNPSPLTALQPMADSQLMADTVRLTFYGTNNQQARQWFNGLIQYSLNTDAFGFMSSPAFRDDKRTQSEISAIAMKKTLSFKASYYQQTADAFARRLILSASVSFAV